MDTNGPKTIGAVRTLMGEAVAEFHASVQVRPTEAVPLLLRARARIRRLHKLFRHHIEDQMRRDAKRHWGLTDAQRLGQTAQLNEVTANALRLLEVTR